MTEAYLQFNELYHIKLLAQSLVQSGSFRMFEIIDSAQIIEEKRTLCHLPYSLKCLLKDILEPCLEVITYITAH